MIPSPSLTPMPGSPLAAAEVVLRTISLTKRFGRRVAVNDLSLEVHRGDVFGLLGPNGSGKTTTLRMVLGLVWPTAGEVVVFDGSMAAGAHRTAALRRIGAIVEQPAFYPYLSGADNLRGVAAHAGMPDTAATRARITGVLASVGLDGHARVASKQYSLGMKQRLGIAAALLSRPDLIVLDEPTNGLDPAGMVEVRALVSQLAQQGITVVLASHLLHEVQQVCTRVAILKAGTLVGQGSVRDLLATQRGVQLGFAQQAELVRAVEVLRAAGAERDWLRGAQYVPPEPGGWVPPGGWMLLVDAPGDRASDINALLAAQGLYAAEVHRHEASLEQYFLAHTSAAPAGAPTAPSAAVGATERAEGGQGQW